MKFKCPWCKSISCDPIVMMLPFSNCWWCNCWWCGKEYFGLNNRTQKTMPTIHEITWKTMNAYD